MADSGGAAGDSVIVTYIARYRKVTRQKDKFAPLQRDGFELENLVGFGRFCGLKKAESLVRDMSNYVQKSWMVCADMAGGDESMADLIRKAMRTNITGHS